MARARCGRSATAAAAAAVSISIIACDVTCALVQLESRAGCCFFSPTSALQVVVSDAFVYARLRSSEYDLRHLEVPHGAECVIMNMYVCYSDYCRRLRCSAVHRQQQQQQQGEGEGTLGYIIYCNRATRDD